jgi:hypothetical protein
MCFTLSNVYKIHLCYMYQYFVSFYGWIIFHYMCVYTIFIYFPVDRPLWCFFFLAVINSDAISILAQIFVWTLVFSSLWYMHVVGYIQYHRAAVCLNFWGTSKLSSTVTTPFLHFYDSAYKFQFLCIHACLCFMYFGEVAMQFVIFLCSVFLEIDVPLL